MLEAMIQMFWLVGTKIVSELLIPVIAIWLVFNLFISVLFRTNER